VASPLVLKLEHGRAVAVDGVEDIPAAVGALDLGAPRPTIVVVGGAAGLDDNALAGLESLAGGIVRAAAACGAVIVDGGTDAGVMRLVGRARAQASVPISLLGVVVRSLAVLPGQTVVGPMAALEPHHTHFVLVPGSSWGEEAPWIASVAGAIAGSCASVSVLVNGGEIAWTDVAESLEASRRVLVVAGTGRTADALAAAATRGPSDARAAALVGTELVEAVGPGGDTAAALERRIEHILTGSEPADAR
jgi:hypothetical protein